MLGCAERIEVNCLFWLIFLYLTLRKNLLSQDILFVYTKVKTHAVKDVHTPSPFPPPHFKISSPRSSISMILPFLGMSCVLFFYIFSACNEKLFNNICTALFDNKGGVYHCEYEKNYIKAVTIILSV